MARGPFAVDPNSAPDLSPINLKGGTSVVVPKVDVVGPLTDLALAGAEFYTETQKAAATQQLNKELKTVRDALQVSRFPGLEQTFFGQEAQKNPYFKEVLKEFQGIRSAQRQGRLTSEYAVERMESVVSQAIARTPAFAEEIRTAARDTLGFDPQNKVMANLLRESPQDTARKQLEAAAQKVGMSTDDYIALNQSMFVADGKLKQLQLAKAEGQYSAAQVGQEVRLTAASASMEVMNTVSTQIASGGVAEPEQLKSHIQQTFAAADLQLMNGMPSTVDATTISNERAILARMKDDMLSMVDNGSLLKILETKNATFTAAAKQDILNIPRINKLYAVMPESAVLEVMNQLGRFQANPGAMNTVLASGKGGALFLSDMLEQMDSAADVLSGQREADTPQEANTAAWLATKTLQTGVQTGAEAHRLVSVLRQAGADVSVAGLSDPRVVKTVATMKETHGEVINFFAEQTAALATQYQLLLNNGDVPENPSELRNGRLPLAQGTQAGSREVPAQGYNSWARNVNRLLDMGDRYRAAGVMPDTKYQNAPAFVTDLTKNKQPQQEPAAPQVFDFDPETGTFTSVGN